jgi:hypothetical protein
VQESGPIVDVAVDTQGASQITGVAVGTLNNWRSQGRGPAFVRLGKAIRYRTSDLREYLDQHRVEPIR